MDEDQIMFSVIDVSLSERAVVLKNGLPVQALAPGRHRVWGFGLTALRFDVQSLVFDAASEVRAMLPADWFDEVIVAPHERAIVHKDGVPVLFLRPGVHRIWTVDPGVALELHRVDEPMPELSDELEHIIPRDEYVDVMVQAHEKVVILKDGLPFQALAPGRHRVWGVDLTELRFDVHDLVLSASSEVRAMLPADWFDEVIVAPHERAILRKDGVPERFLRPGVHHIFSVDPGVALELHRVDEPMPELSDELVCIIPGDEYVDVMVQAHEKALYFVQGHLREVLEPGRYSLWSHPSAKVELQKVDMRQSELQLAGQELMTRDKVTLRLSLAVEFAITDPAVAMQKVANPRDAIYLMVQLAARDFIAGLTLDELLEGRGALTRHLEEVTSAQAAAIGVRIARVGVKDVVLPGEMKLLLNRVIEAEKEAAANVILRREETAATRSLANTAKMMAASPVLLRLKELESLKEIAGEVGEVRLVVGSDGLDKLALGGLLTSGGNA
jgi:regulator of protease activity HflC (stomatin/prohibitin superfamily)